MDAGGEAKSEGQQKNNHHSNHHLFRLLSRVAVLLGVVFVTCFVLYRSAYPLQLLPRSSSSYAPLHRGSAWTNSSSFSMDKREAKLKGVLKKAAMGDKTVIITTLNEAWAAPDSIFDLFLESFRIGNQTKRLLNNLVVVALDQKAYDRCLALHPHCYFLTTNGKDLSGEAFFMTPNYLDMMWRRILFLHSVLKLGYNFVFTDADITWFRDPFPHFYQDADFQIACDYYRGNPTDLTNAANGGFNYVKSNNHTISFYKFWYTSRVNYPKFHDQDVFNKIKFDPFLAKIGVKIKFLDTSYFGGFCQPSGDLDRVCTMHANCCIGLVRKVHDIKAMLEDWRRFLKLPANVWASKHASWTVPQMCSMSLDFSDLPKKKVQQGRNN